MKALRYFFCVVLPPVAVLMTGRLGSFLLSIVLTLLGWIPGIFTLALWSTITMKSSAPRATPWPASRDEISFLAGFPNKKNLLDTQFLFQIASPVEAGLIRVAPDVCASSA